MDDETTDITASYCECIDPMPMPASDRVGEALTAICGRCLCGIDPWQIGS